jgi:hypothetical protein
VRALTRLIHLAARALPVALAVDRAAAAEQHVRREVPCAAECVREFRRAHDVDAGVTAGLVERLRGARLGGEVDDHVGLHIRQQRVPGARVGDIADDEFGLGVEVGRRLRAAVHLWMQ